MDGAEGVNAKSAVKVDAFITVPNTTLVVIIKLMFVLHFKGMAYFFCIYWKIIWPLR